MTQKKKPSGVVQTTSTQPARFKGTSTSPKTTTLAIRPETTQNCQQHADCFQKPGLQHERQMHYLFSHMDRFPENLCSMSDKQRKRFHQDRKLMETRYQGRWDAVMMADYCLNLKRDLPVAEHSRSSKKRKFKPWSLNNGEATCYLRVLTFINTHHSVYSNRCFYQVINICCWQNIFSLKNIFRVICVDKNLLIMPQKCNRFCHKIWFFSNQLSTKTVHYFAGINY